MRIITKIRSHLRMVAIGSDDHVRLVFVPSFEVHFNSLASIPLHNFYSFKLFLVHHILFRNLLHHLVSQ